MKSIFISLVAVALATVAVAFAADYGFGGGGGSATSFIAELFGRDTGGTATRDAGGISAYGRYD